VFTGWLYVEGERRIERDTVLTPPKKNDYSYIVKLVPGHHYTIWVRLVQPVAGSTLRCLAKRELKFTASSLMIIIRYYLSVFSAHSRDELQVLLIRAVMLAGTEMEVCHVRSSVRNRSKSENVL
jgi:protease II